MRCPLCAEQAVLFFRLPEKTYFQCGCCAAIFLDPACYLGAAAEKQRYEQHNNDIRDSGYRNFVAPLVADIARTIPSGQQGLDFGAGTGPVAAALLRDKGYQITLYDPFFWPDARALSRRYDFVFCCEVIEHFYQPAQEFRRLRSLLNPGGALWCMTQLYTDATDFKTWYYRHDPTHVFFYHVRTLHWIKQQFDFNVLEQQGRVTRFGG